jgi:thiosulfate dehydrogenase
MTGVCASALVTAGLVLGLALGSGCGDEEVPASRFGARLFRDPGLSTSPFNAFSCATCHAVERGAPAYLSGRYDPAPNLAGVVSRPSWWGGYETRLLDAINVCLDEFMGGRRLAPDEDRARQLYAYLEENDNPQASAAVPFTIVRQVGVLKAVRGDPTRGRALYEAACVRCHGAPHSGSGRLTPRATIVPEGTIAAFPNDARSAVEEKIRHGKFFGIGGVMPLYPREALSDLEVADLLAYLGL